MEWSITSGPAYAILRVKLSGGEYVIAEPGAMMLIRGDIRVKTKSGGLLGGLKRALLGGESFFLNIYEAGTGGGEVWFAPGTPGDIAHVRVTPSDPWIVQKGSYLAHTGNLKITTAWRGGKGWLAEGSFWWLKIEGQGEAWVSSYGAIEEVEVPAGEKLIVDNMHLVAMPASVNYKIVKIGGLKTFFFGGEGIGVEIRGPGRVLVQTRILPPFARLIAGYKK